MQGSHLSRENFVQFKEKNRQMCS
uniref:Uncharacterized protein n=1 Tax=Anguilla anguilla TaxID=7936 RepID=A0A0E9W3R1_ANGAN